MDFTIPYSPQLNGKAECLNRTLLEKIRALLEESGLKKEMWGEAAYMAIYLINISPMKTLDVTPYEMQSGKEPDMNYVKLYVKCWVKRENWVDDTYENTALLIVCKCVHRPTTYKKEENITREVRCPPVDLSQEVQNLARLEYI